MNASELRTWLERMGLSQGELAKLLGVHILTVNRWANEARDIPPFLPLALETLEGRLKTEKTASPGRPRKLAKRSSKK